MPKIWQKTRTQEYLKEKPLLKSKLPKSRAAAISAILMLTACKRPQTGNGVLSPRQTEQAIKKPRSAYGAFNRGDIDAAVRLLDEQVEWVEPAEFSGGGTYHGIESAKRYLAQSRAAAAHVISEPEQFIPAGDRIVVFVHARVLPKDSDNWQDFRLADVYTFRDGKVTKMRAFANRSEALQWVSIGNTGR